MKAMTALVALLLVVPAAAQSVYYPAAEPGWDKRRPEQLGFDAAKLQEAVAFAQANESRAPRDLELAHYTTFAREPFGHAIGPFKERGPQTGIIIKNGYIIAEWGEPDRVDMTFSVTKSFVSTTVGLAFDRGMIRSVDDPVRGYMAPVLPADPVGSAGEYVAGRFGTQRTIALFETPHNQKITWDHLLRQVSDWEGTLWGKPEWADRPAENTATWLTRERNAPGSVYEYNDTRVNVLALAALNVWRRPLPEVLRELVMDPIGASSTWRWFGYDNSWIILDGMRVQSVSGGGHWGGGMFISARDQARFGLLTLRNGKWKDRQIISERWLKQSRTPTAANPGYGYMNFFLNTETNGRRQYPGAPVEAWTHVGAGTNAIYCDPVNDLVIVLRWINTNSVDGVIQRVLAAGGKATNSSR